MDALPTSLPMLFTDPGPWFCDETRCRFESDGMPLYRDGGHLSLRGAAFLRPHLEPEFALARSRAGIGPGGGGERAEGTP